LGRSLFIEVVVAYDAVKVVLTRYLFIWESRMFCSVAIEQHLQHLIIGIL